MAHFEFTGLVLSFADLCSEFRMFCACLRDEDLCVVVVHRCLAAHLGMA